MAEMKIPYFLSSKILYSERPWTKILIHDMPKHNWLQIEMRLPSHHSGCLFFVNIICITLLETSQVDGASQTSVGKLNYGITYATRP